MREEREVYILRPQQVFDFRLIYENLHYQGLELDQASGLELIIVLTRY